MIRSLLLILALVQFVSTSGQTCSPDSLVLRSIKAWETDSDIAIEIEEHQVWINPDCDQNGKLLIHFVGSSDNPANTTFLPELAANHGFKVINLKYPNTVAAVIACADSDDPACFETYRQEIIHGVDSSSLVDVDTDNCIINRIEKLLEHLQGLFPSEQWGDFLDTSGEINWSNIAVSGHSQGGGHAAYIAKQHVVERVLMFAAPNDYSDFFSSPAAWLSSPSATPDSSHFAFGNLFDITVDFSKQFDNWTDMNLLAQTDSVNVDNSSCDFNNTSVLYTRYNPSFGFGNHSSVVIDAFTPLSDGSPVFTPVWEYMLGLCGFSNSISATEDFSVTVKLYPNPSASRVFVESEKVISQIEIYSSTGALLQITQPMRANAELNVEPFEGALFLYITLRGSELPLREVLLVH